jgi:RNA processing factor Prp31
MQSNILIVYFYILETTQQLEGKLKDKVERRLADKISFAAEQDVYHGIITQSVQVNNLSLPSQINIALFQTLRTK